MLVLWCIGIFAYLCRWFKMIRILKLDYKKLMYKVLTIFVAVDVEI